MCGQGSGRKPKGDPAARYAEQLMKLKAKDVRSPEAKARRRAKGLEELAEYKEFLKSLPTTWIGVDGEGHDTDEVVTPAGILNDEERSHVQATYRHIYTRLCFSDHTGKTLEILRNDAGLSTKECLDAFLRMGKVQKGRIVGFSLGYDWTMIFKDLPPELLYNLLRPELRADPDDPKKPPQPLFWNGFWLNRIGMKTTIKKGGPKSKNRVVVWDTFRFFGSTFVKAISDWKMCDEETIERISKMKEKRDAFKDVAPEKVEAYCLEECTILAQLIKKLTESCAEANIELESWHGPGSIASVLLKRWNIGEKRDAGLKRMAFAIACAFFGGRFEHAVMGIVRELIYQWDISSAYPYQITFLPCLKHGKWRKVKDEEALEGTRAALIRYRLRRIPNTTWGPLPFRTKDGTVVFPAESGGGWVWLNEYLVAKKCFPEQVEFREAWVLEGCCPDDCRPPFEEVPGLYIERIRIGKEGPGWIIKLALNSLYGKLAQSLGVEPPFQCWIWAGIITSDTRAQLLELMAEVGFENVLGTATDAIYTTKKVDPPKPLDTGTDGCPGPDGKPTHKPLGGWEGKEIKGGMFFARSGLLFGLDPEAEFAKTRGINRRIFWEHREKIIKKWDEGKVDCLLGHPKRFMGAKQWIRRKKVGRHEVYYRHKVYGCWAPYPARFEFNPLPKRAPYPGKREELIHLPVRYLDPDVESAPYDRAVVSPEAEALKKQKEFEEDQKEGYYPEDFEGTD